MAHHMSSILGSALLTSPLGDTMPTDFPSPEVCVRTASSKSLCRCEDASLSVCATLQELRGRVLIKGKRLNKLEASFAEEAAAGEDTDVTEEDESGSDNENDEEPKESKVRVSSGRFEPLN